jgi:AbrB family looped-hinge helix DNA binding protein
MQKQARITSKGQITVPREVRRVLGVRAGDRLLFEALAIPGSDLAERASADGYARCVDNDDSD